MSGLDDKQMARFEQLSAQESWTDSEVEELQQLDNLLSGKPPPETDANSPLARALEQQQGDMVTVETPTGPARFTRSGSRVYSPAEAQELGLGGGAADLRARENALNNALAFFGSGGKMLDEIRGAGMAVNAVPEWLARGMTGRSPADAYGETVRGTRKDVSEAVRRSPSANVAGVDLKPVALAGAMAPQLAGGLPASIAGRIAASSAGAAIDELGGSEAETLGGVAGDVARAGATGAALSGAMEGLGVPVRAVGNRVGGAASRAFQALKDQIQAAADKAEASALGQLRQQIGVQGNVMEKVSEVLKNPSLFSPQTVADAQAFVASPEGQTLLNRAVANNLGKAQALIPEEVELRAALSAARAAAQPEAVMSRAVERADLGNVASDLGEKAWNSIGQRAALGLLGGAAGAGYSALTGSDRAASTIGGALVGGIAPGALQFARNQARSPAVQHSALTLARDALGGAMSGFQRAASLVTPAARTQGRTVRPPMAPEEDRGGSLTARLDGQAVRRAMNSDEEDAINSFLQAP